MMLGEYLRAATPPWDWIQHDCSRWLDRYLVLRGHQSPMAAIYVAYDSERSAKLFMGRGGGLLALWTRGMEAVGIPSTDTPSPGDVAILSIPTDDGDDVTCGIWSGQRWASVHRHGTIFGHGQPLQIWSVG